MAFNTLEYLEEGKVDFVYLTTPYDYQNLIKNVRASERRTEIVNGFLAKLRDEKPSFCFDIIYDMDEFVDDTKYLLDNYYTLESFTKEQLESFLNNCSLGFSYVEENFESILDKFKDDLDFLFKYLFSNFDKCIELLKKLAFHQNLHIRYLFMKYLIINHKQLIGSFYDDITRYLTSETYQEFEQLSLFKDYMDMKDICELAYLFFSSNIDYETWLKFKQFILTNYQHNELAAQLLGYKREYLSETSYRLVVDQNGVEEFKKDADTYFATSSNYRLAILNRFSKEVSQKLLDAYRLQLTYFEREGKLDEVYKKLEAYGLGRMVIELVDKYLSLSDKQDYSFVGEGSTASCYRIGDYVFKLVRSKWSYEQVICPNLYLILPNIEEKFIRDSDGVVLSGIEVQKYLSRSASNIPLRIFTNFKDELNRLGYYTTDSLISGTCGDNCKLLDSYLESGNPNPPNWFKKYPVVLIDRDRVYKVGSTYIKQLRGGY